MAQILHVDLQDFLVSVERKHDPSLHGRPIVIGGQPTGWGRVVAASREAAARGVKPGMSLSVAASRCPRAVFLDGALDRYLDASAAIDELLREPGLPVEWTSIDSAFIDLTPDRTARERVASSVAGRDAMGAVGVATVGVATVGASQGGTRMPGHRGEILAPRQIAERVQTALREQLGFEAACGIASTKVAAQIASRLARPAGLLYVLPGYEERLLAPLDCALLPDLPVGLAPRLHRAGVLTLRQLATIDLQVAEPLLGRRAAEFARLARGLDDRAVDGAAPPRSIAREVTLPQPPPRHRPGLGRPTLIEPIQGEQARDLPIQGQSTHGRPAQSHPAQDQPGQGHPAQGQPASGGPAYGEPAHGGSASGESAFGERGQAELLHGQSIQSPAELESVAQYLTETLATRLRRMGCFAQTITVRLRGGTPERTLARSTTLREATASDGDLVAAAQGLLHVLRRSWTAGMQYGHGTQGATQGHAAHGRWIAGVSVVLSNLHQGGAQLPLFPLTPATTHDIWSDLRGHASFRAHVHGRFIAPAAPAAAPAARRAG